MAKADGKIWQRSQANKKRIYFSAMRLFAAHGYDNVSIDDIVREAKSSKGTFYNYFRSKDELFVFYNQALDERILNFRDKLLQSKHYAGDCALEKLYIITMYILHVLEESGREFTAISDTRQLRNEFGEAAAEDVLCNSSLNIFPPLIEMGKRDGSIDRTIDSAKTGLLLYIYLKGIVYEWECSDPPIDLVESAAPIVEFFCHSIAPPQPSDAS